MKIGLNIIKFNKNSWLKFQMPLHLSNIWNELLWICTPSAVCISHCLYQFSTSYKKLCSFFYWISTAIVIQNSFGSWFSFLWVSLRMSKSIQVLTLHIAFELMFADRQLTVITAANELAELSHSLRCPILLSSNIAAQRPENEFLWAP